MVGEGERGRRCLWPGEANHGQQGDGFCASSSVREGIDSGGTQMVRAGPLGRCG